MRFAIVVIAVAVAVICCGALLFARDDVYAETKEHVILVPDAPYPEVTDLDVVVNGEHKRMLIDQPCIYSFYSDKEAEVRVLVYGDMLEPTSLIDDGEWYHMFQICKPTE